MHFKFLYGLISHFLFVFVNLFINFFAVSGLSCARRIFHCSVWALCCGACRLLSSCGTWAPEHTGSAVVALGLSSCGTWAPEHVGSLLVARRLSSCIVRAQLPRGVWDLSTPTRDQTHIPCIGRWILNHWTTREVPISHFFLALNNTPLSGCITVYLSFHLQKDKTWLLPSFGNYKIKLL